jgi:hypothetical protein
MTDLEDAAAEVIHAYHAKKGWHGGQPADVAWAEITRLIDRLDVAVTGLAEALSGSTSPGPPAGDSDPPAAEAPDLPTPGEVRRELPLELDELVAMAETERPVRPSKLRRTI